MAENLDNLLPADHFFNKAIYFAKGLLLLYKVFGAAATYILYDEQHQPQKDKHEEGKPHTGTQHGNEYCCDADDGTDRVGQALADHLPQGIGIVGVVAHHIAMGMGIKVLDGQGLHVGKHIVPYGFQGALRHGDHQPCLQVGSQHTGQVNAPHHGQSLKKRGEAWCRLSNKRSDIIIDQRFEEKRGGNTGYCTDDE